MNTYYTVMAHYENKAEILFGSFDKQDCKDEIEAEKESWKDQGYKKIQIISEQVEDAPDSGVYGDMFVTSKELYQQQAPAFNFEKDQSELLEYALEVGFVTKAGDDLYKMNFEYFDK